MSATAQTHVQPQTQSQANSILSSQSVDGVLKNGNSQAANAPDEAVETFERTNLSLSHLATEGMSCYTDALTAAIESSTEMTKALSDISRSSLSACTSTANSIAELGRTAIACRTPADIMALHKEGLQIFDDAYRANLKLYNEFYEACSKTLQPVVAQATDVPERIFRAAAF